jgi:hypothetical protein
VSPELLEAYAGKFQGQGMPLVIIYTHEDDGLYAQATGQPKLALLAQSDSVFSYQGVAATVTFHRNDDGTVNTATHEQGGRSLQLKRLTYNPTANELAVYTGRYYSSELETFYTFKLDGGKLVALHRRMDTIRLEPQAEDDFRGSSGTFGLVKFERNDKGNITGFRVSNGRTRDILFTKEN